MSAQEGVEQVFQTPAAAAEDGNADPPSPPELTKPAMHHRQYIKDRCNGESKYDTSKRPPCPPCFPPPCVAYLPDLLEQNGCCEFVGRFGIDADAKVRRQVFGIALGANIVAFVFNFFACFSIATDFNLLKAASFSMGHVTVPEAGPQFRDLGMYVGLRAVAFQNDNPIPGLESTGPFTFDEFCAAYNDKLEGLVSEYTCGTCKDTSNALVSSIIMSLVTILPSIFTDVNRMYANYDVNCQKFFGVIIASVSMVFSLYTFLGYNRKCFESFYDAQAGVYVFRNGTRTDFATEETNQALFRWEPGNGLVAMYVATALKIIDILANLLVATPSITRDHEEQMEYEALYGGKAAAADLEEQAAAKQTQQQTTEAMQQQTVES